jgi:hypothetical protein
MSAPTRPPIVLAAGQVWCADDGEERAILAVHDKTAMSQPWVRVKKLPHGRPMAMAPMSMRAWIGRHQAVVDDA